MTGSNTPKSSLRIPGQLSADGEVLRGTGFALLYTKGEPVELDDLADAIGWTVEYTEGQLDEVERVGRALRNTDGALVAIAGLSLEPTDHEIRVDGRRFWTWCGLDAIGIISALGGTGQVASAPPDRSETIEIDFVDGVPTSSGALFLFDGYEGGSVRDTWCRHVNLFHSVEEAREFAEENDLVGEAVALAEIVGLAGETWSPVVAGAL